MRNVVLPQGVTSLQFNFNGPNTFDQTSCFDFAQSFASRFSKLERLTLTDPLFLAWLEDENDADPLARATKLDNSLLVRALHDLALRCSVGPDFDCINDDRDLTDQVDARIMPLLNQWLTNWIKPTNPNVHLVIFDSSHDNLAATLYRWGKQENWDYDVSLGPSWFAR